MYRVAERGSGEGLRWEGGEAWKGGLWTLLRGLKCHQMTSVGLSSGNSVDRMRGERIRGQICVSMLIPIWKFL